MAGLLRPTGKARRGQSRGRWWLSPAGISQAAALSPPADVGLVGSCCLCPSDVVFCCLFRLAFWRGSLAQELCPQPLRRGVNGLRTLSSDRQGEGGFGGRRSLGAVWQLLEPLLGKRGLFSH